MFFFRVKDATQEEAEEENEEMYAKQSDSGTNTDILEPIGLMTFTL